MAGHSFFWRGVRYVAQGVATGVGGPIGGQAVGAGFDYVNKQMRDRTGGSSTATEGGMFEEGADIEILSEAQARAMGLPMGNGQRRRRRRRKLLTCGDKADIAFLHGNLGGGQLGRSAISAVLSRRCS